MTMSFWWKPDNNPVSESGANSHRRDIGLELGGNDTTSIVTTGTDGRVRLYEVRYSQQQGRGQHESSDDRLIATFHGRFHRKTTGPASQRITFEINGTSTVAAHNGQVQGFDPECVLGVDAFVLTFVNREFIIYLPFFIDRRSEGDYMEIRAVAETGTVQSSTVVKRSEILKLRIRRTNREVVTTTVSPSGGGDMRYTGDVVGNLVMFHENFLLQGVTRSASAAWPAPVNPEYIVVPWSGNNRIPFQPYSDGSLKILLTNDLMDDLIPTESYLQRNVGGISSAQQAQQARTQLRTRVRNGIVSTLRDILTNAGFTSPNVWWQGDTAASALLTEFTQAFHYYSDSGRWSLSNSQNPLDTSFWNFFVTRDSSISVVGFSERKIVHHEFSPTGGNIVYLLSTVPPIGSGNKWLDAPIKIKTGYFLGGVTRGGSRSHASLDPVFNDIMDGMTDKVAICIAHEIGHSLGLMHQVMVRSNTPYRESLANGALSLMCCTIDSNSFGRNMFFSSQAKVVLNRAFGVTPQDWNATYLQNKTWGNDWATTDWATRMRTFYQQHHEDGMRQSYLSAINPNPTAPGALLPPPPYAGTGTSVQIGTYVPPSP